MMSGNLLGPALHSVQRVNANSRGSAIIECDSAIIKERMNMGIKIIRDDLIKITSDKDQVIAFTSGLTEPSSQPFF